MIKINLRIRFPDIFLIIKAVLMALCCFEAVMTNSIVERIICFIAYVVFVHCDIIMYVDDDEDDIDDNEYKKL